MEDETKASPTLASNSHLSSNSFVTAKNGSLYLDDQLFRFASFNAPELFDGDVNGQFEYEDTMDTFSATGAFGRAVTRTYTLRVSCLLPFQIYSLIDAKFVRILLDLGQVEEHWEGTYQWMESGVGRLDLGRSSPC